MKMQLDIYRIVFALSALVIGIVQAAAILGIDYGQEFTKSSLVSPPGISFEVVLGSDSRRKELSGIAFKPSSSDIPERLYGNSVTEVSSRLPGSSALYLKGLLGVDINSAAVDDFRAIEPALELVPSKNNRSTISVNILGEVYPVEELVAMGFSHIKSRANAMLESASSSSKYVQNTAVSIPVFSTTSQRKALGDALEIAGLNLVSLINDGVAVAVNFASSRQFESKKNYLVYDVGAGSTTATLVSIYPGEIPISGTTITRTGTIIDVLGVGYDAQVGGQLLTLRLRDLLIEKFCEKHGDLKNDILKENRTLARFWREAERAKMVLSANNDVYPSIESVYQEKDLRAHVTREEFEALASDLKPRFLQPLSDAMKCALAPEGKPVDIDTLEAIILHGGSSRVPFILQQLQTFAGDSNKISKNVNADEADVQGTALRGIGISGILKSKDIHVIDRAIWDYEYVSSAEKETLFEMGTPLGTVKSLKIDPDTDTSITLLENNVEFVMFELTNLKSVTKDLKQGTSKCIGELDVSAKFQLSQSRTVDLLEVVAKCNATVITTKTKTFRESATQSTSDSTESTDSSTESAETTTQSTSGSTSTSVTPTVSTTTTVETSVRELTRQISAKPIYKGPRPMGTASKQSAQSRLKTMNKADFERQMKATHLNDFESLLYHAQDLVGSDESYEEYVQKLSQFSEWFENNEYSELSSKEVLVKVKDLENFISTITNGEAETSDTPNVSEEEKHGYQELTELMTRLETLDLTADERLQISKMLSTPTEDESIHDRAALLRSYLDVLEATHKSDKESNAKKHNHDDL